MRRGEQPIEAGPDVRSAPPAPPLQWAEPLAVADVARNAGIIGATGLAIGGVVFGLVQFAGVPAAAGVLVTMFIHIGGLVVITRLLRRWHGRNRSATAITAAGVETLAWIVCSWSFVWWLGTSWIMLAVYTPVAWAFWNASMFRRFWRQNEYLRFGATCPGCGHMLLGVPSVQCPECGYVFHEGEQGIRRGDLIVPSEEALPPAPRF